MRQLRTFLVVAGLLIAAAAPASAAPPSTDHTTNARAAAAWLGSQLSANGTVETAPGAVNYSLTIQALIALETAGVGGALVDKGLAFVGSTVEAYVHAGTTDDPGALAYVIIAVVLRGQDPTSFGTGATDLVQRLKATERGAADPDAGLFGASAPDFDGAYRQGLALLALHASGATASATAIAWLEDQQCGNGLWLA
ncbi:MAG: hypothetical protein ABIV94_01040, partial [Acidimicrobiales bacterium]